MQMNPFRFLSDRNPVAEEQTEHSLLLLSGFERHVGRHDLNWDKPSAPFRLGQPKPTAFEIWTWVAQGLRLFKLKLRGKKTEAGLPTNIDSWWWWWTWNALGEKMMLLTRVVTSAAWLSLTMCWINWISTAWRIIHHWWEQTLLFQSETCRPVFQSSKFINHATPAKVNQMQIIYRVSVSVYVIDRTPPFCWRIYITPLAKP